MQNSKSLSGKLPVGGDANHNRQNRPITAYVNNQQIKFSYRGDSARRQKTKKFPYL